MLDVLRSWVYRFLSDEEAVLFALLLLTMLFLLLTMGDTLVPLLASIVLAFLLQGFIAVLIKRRVPSSVAVLLTFMLFLGGFIGVLVFIVPLVWQQMPTCSMNFPIWLTKARNCCRWFTRTTLIC